MLMYELIMKKRDGGELTQDEINFVIEQYTNSNIPDYQMSAMLMAIFLKNMSFSETTDLTQAMLNSGETLSFKKSRYLYVDKHSTGGVGDKLSLILAPIVASLGIPVPMIAGRGLGHTGGTLDKLEAIPGFSVNLSIDQFKQHVEDHHLCIIGQTSTLAPADKKIYALRDVTATVSSIPLITASIMSKKLAEGIDALVMDIKFGSGAFMQKKSEATALAESIVEIGRLSGKKVIAYLTDMNDPLGTHVGNWLEIVETIQSLKGQGPEDSMDVTHQLAGTMIYLSGFCDSIEEGMRVSKMQIENGQAWEKFKELVQLQGGDLSFIEDPASYPNADKHIEIQAKKDGFISEMDALKLGLLTVRIGAGRETITDEIDFRTGFILNKKVGDYVREGDQIATVYLREQDDSEFVTEQFHLAIHYSDQEISKSTKIDRMIQ